MKHLFNRAYLTSDLFFGEPTKRIIVSKDYTEIFFNQNVMIEERLKNDSEIGTIINERDPEKFVSKTLPELLDSLLTIEEQFRFICDDEAYLRLYTFFLKCLISNLTFEQFLDIVKINALERMVNDRLFTLPDTPYVEKRLKHIFINTVPPSDSIELCKEKFNLFSLEFKILASLSGSKETGAKETLHKLAKEKAYRIITDTQRDVVLMSRNGRLSSFIDADLPVLDGVTPPMVDFVGVENLIKCPDITTLVLEKGLDDPFITSVLSDLKKIDPFRTEILKGLLEMLLEDNERLVVDLFMSCLNKVSSLTEILPNDLEKRVSVNTLFWGVDQVKKGNLTFNC